MQVEFFFFFIFWAKCYSASPKFLETLVECGIEYQLLNSICIALFLKSRLYKYYVSFDEK